MLQIHEKAGKLSVKGKFLEKVTSKERHRIWISPLGLKDGCVELMRV